VPHRLRWLGDGTVAVADVIRRSSAVGLARLRALEPGLAPAVQARLVDWASDRFAGGGYSAIPPGAPGSLPALERPFGAIVLCGEHTAGLRWHGTMEGAIRSGRRAAAQSLELLSSG
jgi:monoamine oxidase